MASPEHRKFVAVTIPEKIRTERRKRGLSQKKFGEALNVHLRTVQQWESGQIKPSGESLKNLEKFTGKPMSWFTCDGLLDASFSMEEAIKHGVLPSSHDHSPEHELEVFRKNFNAIPMSKGSSGAKHPAREAARRVSHRSPMERLEFAMILK